jgi:hypothetical protein
MDFGVSLYQEFFFNLAVEGSSFLPALKHLDPFNQCLVPIVR